MSQGVKYLTASNLVDLTDRMDTLIGDYFSKAERDVVKQILHFQIVQTSDGEGRGWWTAVVLVETMPA